MSFTELDANTALVVVDLQKGGVGAPMAHHSAAHIFPQIAETGTTAELLGLLESSPR
jgi:hypothetical protein